MDEYPLDEEKVEEARESHRKVVDLFAALQRARFGRLLRAGTLTW